MTSLTHHRDISTPLSVERRDDVEDGDGEVLHWMWVRGPEGAVATWFSPRTKPIIGYSVCDGPVIHSARPDERCEFGELECHFVDDQPCFAWRIWGYEWSRKLSELFDIGNEDAVYALLEALYGADLAP